MISRIANVYAQTLKRSPFWTQVGVSTTIAIAGDITCQCAFSATTSRTPLGASQASMLPGQPPPGKNPLRDNKEENSSVGNNLLKNGLLKTFYDTYDIERTIRFGTVRFCQFCIMVPWLSILERVRYINNAWTVAAKIALDQLVWTPPSMCVFYTSMAMLEGEQFDAGVDRAKNLLWPTLRINWPFWTCVHCLTFTVVPIKFRMIWISTIMVGWNAFLSHMNQTSSHSVPDAMESVKL